MSHAPKRWSIKGAVFAASLTVVFAACGRLDGIAERQQPRRDRRHRPPHRPVPPPSAAAFDGIGLPGDG